MERRAARNGDEVDHFTRKTRHHSRLKDSSRVKRNARRRERHIVCAELRQF
jgi:hypothetical protein